MSFSKASAIGSCEQAYKARLHEGWDVVGNTRGGHPMAIDARALATAVAQSLQLALTPKA